VFAQETAGLAPGRDPQGRQGGGQDRRRTWRGRALHSDAAHDHGVWRAGRGLAQIAKAGDEIRFDAVLEGGKYIVTRLEADR